MLPRTQRLDRQAFRQVQQSRSVLKAQDLSLRFRCARRDTPSRFSVVVPRVAAPRATTRNKLRRRLYYVIAHHLRDSPCGLEGIVYVRRSLPSFKALETEVLGLLHEAEKRCTERKP